MSAVRCAMCYTHINKVKESPTQESDNAACRQQSTLLITHYDNNDDSSSSSSHHCNKRQGNNDKLWPCLSCTYENRLNSSNCSMCGWVNTKASRKNTTKGQNNQKNESVYHGSNINHINNNNNVKWSNQVVPQTIYSDINTLQQMQFYNDKNNQRNHVNIPTCYSDGTDSKSDTSTSAIDSKQCSKWICSQCTYENFAKSLRCVMCHNPRHQREAEINLNQLNGSHDININPNKNEYNTSPSVNSNSSLIHNITNHASKRNKPESCYITYSPSEDIIDSPYDTDVKIDNHHSYETFPMTEEDLNQIKNRLSSEEWLWLGACQGVKTGKRRLVEQYISSGKIY